MPENNIILKQRRLQRLSNNQYTLNIPISFIESLGWQQHEQLRLALFIDKGKILIDKHNKESENKINNIIQPQPKSNIVAERKPDIDSEINKLKQSLNNDEVAL